MASVSNGLAAFNKGTILPVTSTFFMFYLVSNSFCTRGEVAKFYLVRSARNSNGRIAGPATDPYRNA